MDAERAKWNRAADEYQSTFHRGINEYNAALMRFLQEGGLLTPGGRVIDIGCGVGKYGTYFARLGCDVTLTDISDDMIRHAKNNMAEFDTPWTAFRCDFNEITGAEAEFAGKFDFAISTMSPAIHDVATVRRMSEMTRGWCLVARFYAARKPFRDALLRALDLEARKKPPLDLAGECDGLVAAVRAAGYSPSTRIVDYNWADERTPEEMADYLAARCFDGAADCAELRARALARLHEICPPGGRVTDAVETKVMWIYWQTGGTI